MAIGGRATNPVVAVVFVLSLWISAIPADAGDNNPVFQPCADTKIQRKDGFTFGIAFSDRDSFFFNGTQLSPCDSRLSLASKGAQLAVFRPKVDEISLLTINTTTSFAPVTSGGFMVVFAGRKYAARSFPIFVGNTSYVVTSFTLVLEFQKGTLQNLYWKRDGCASCSGKSNFVCLSKQDCAIKTSSCKGQGGSVDCSIGIQLTFSGTDKHYAVLNSWYEVSNLRQYSLYGLYSNLRDSLTSQYHNVF
ncbi:hypothetical protein HPP92_015136 [Vanilla planifolia]|uniref:Expp1 protein n=1 Tax=Vanilla planifolia TaxID=51239 RepID=A0A835UWX8_VANPL|nr:hypothetical protein HPP92_015642 [Vanilla planifolia]KAG0475450.1 hypothetical protein HPP92_015136 [Vanilla planifolia]